MTQKSGTSSTQLDNGMLSFRSYTVSLVACLYTYLQYFPISNIFCVTFIIYTAILEPIDDSMKQFWMVKLYKKIMFNFTESFSTLHYQIYVIARSTNIILPFLLGCTEKKF